jgi:hypothetical protein
VKEAKGIDCDDNESDESCEKPVRHVHAIGHLESRVNSVIHRNERDGERSKDGTKRPGALGAIPRDRDGSEHGWKPTRPHVLVIDKHSPVDHIVILVASEVRCSRSTSPRPVGREPTKGLNERELSNGRAQDQRLVRGDEGVEARIRRMK